MKNEDFLIVTTGTKSEAKSSRGFALTITGVDNQHGINGYIDKRIKIQVECACVRMNLVFMEHRIQKIRKSKNVLNPEFEKWWTMVEKEDGPILDMLADSDEKIDFGKEVGRVVGTAKNLDEVLKKLVAFFKFLDSQRMGYVAGVITSDGPGLVQRNVEMLKKYTERVRLAQSFPVFSSTDVFGETGLWERLAAKNYSYQDWVLFWRKVLGRGKITDIFMAPSWERSVGARDEWETAKKKKD